MRPVEAGVADGSFLLADCDASAEPATKRARVIVDESDVYAKALLAAAPGAAALSTPADVRRLLAQPLPTPVLVDESHVVLLAEGAGCFPMQVRPAERAMPELETLLESAFRSSPIPSGYGEVQLWGWAMLADALTGHVWRTLSALAGMSVYVDSCKSTNRVVDRSGATQRARPAYCGWLNRALVVKAEHKATTPELRAALDELASKTHGWNALIMRGLPFLPCFAVGGQLIQFAVMYGGPDGAACVEAVTDPLSMATRRDRLRVVATSFNMFRILASLRDRMPEPIIPLYREQLRADGGSVTVFDDHVVKLCRRVAPAALYDALASDDIPCAVRVLEHTLPCMERPLARLKLRPVALQALPRDAEELRRAAADVLRCLAALHAAGFVHRDVRWPNVLTDGAGGWLLADFELADVAGEALPTGAIDPDAVAPEVRAPDAPYTPADDVWQVGRLLVSAGVPLPPGGAELADALTAPRAERLGAAEAVVHPWLAHGASS